MRTHSHEQQNFTCAPKEKDQRPALPCGPQSDEAASCPSYCLIPLKIEPAVSCACTNTGLPINEPEKRAWPGPDQIAHHTCPVTAFVTTFGRISETRGRFCENRPSGAERALKKEHGAHFQILSSHSNRIVAPPSVVIWEPRAEGVTAALVLV